MGTFVTRVRLPRNGSPRRLDAVVLRRHNTLLRRIGGFVGLCVSCVAFISFARWCVFCRHIVVRLWRRAFVALIGDAWRCQLEPDFFVRTRKVVVCFCSMRHGGHPRSTRDGCERVTRLADGRLVNLMSSQRWCTHVVSRLHRPSLCLCSRSCSRNLVLAVKRMSRLALAKSCCWSRNTTWRLESGLPPKTLG